MYNYFNKLTIAQPLYIDVFYIELHQIWPRNVKSKDIISFILVGKLWLSHESIILLIFISNIGPTTFL